MTHYSLDTELPSCSAPRQLLADLEGYLSRKVDELIGKKPTTTGELAEKKPTHEYGVDIEDALGNERLTSIEEYAFHVFPNDTKVIRLSRSADDERFKIAVTISFRPGLPASNVRITCEGSSAREIAHGVLTGILRTIEPYKNTNHLYHSPLMFFVAFCGLAMLVFGAVFSTLRDPGITITVAQRHIALATAMSGGIVLVGTFLLQKMSPYTVFETKLNQRRAAKKNFLLYGVGASLIASVIYGLFKGI
jgi:hypothetical protein